MTPFPTCLGFPRLGFPRLGFILLFSLFPALPALGEATGRVFVSNEKDNTVTVIDSSTDTVEATFEVGHRPRGVGLSPDHQFLYVALGEDNAIAVVDVESLRLLRKIPSGSDPEAFAVHPGGVLYLSNEDDRMATALDPDSGKILAQIQVGIEPEGVGVSPDGRWVMVTSESTSLVHVIAVPSHTVVANILVAPRPREVVFTADSRWAYVTSELGREVSRIDVQKLVIDKKKKLDIPKAKPKGILLSQDEKILFISLGRANQVAVLDALTFEVKKVIPVGKRVWGLALTRAGDRIYTCNGVDNTVSIIETKHLEVLKTLDVGTAPWGVVIDD
jgi:PQQ-dependent catabolism-associated beta-propeller protein